MIRVSVNALQSVVNPDEVTTLSASAQLQGGAQTVTWTWTVDSNNLDLNADSLLSSATADTLVSCAALTNAVHFRVCRF